MTVVPMYSSNYTLELFYVISVYIMYGRVNITKNISIASSNIRIATERFDPVKH